MKKGKNKDWKHVAIQEKASEVYNLLPGESQGRHAWENLTEPPPKAPPAHSKDGTNMGTNCKGTLLLSPPFSFPYPPIM